MAEANDDLLRLSYCCAPCFCHNLSQPPVTSSLPQVAPVLLMAVCSVTADVPPNVILVMADDQGWGDIGYNTYTYQNAAYNTTWKFNPPRCGHKNSRAFPHSVDCKYSLTTSWVLVRLLFWQQVISSDYQAAISLILDHISVAQSCADSSEQISKAHLMLTTHDGTNSKFSRTDPRSRLVPKHHVA